MRKLFLLLALVPLLAFGQAENKEKKIMVITDPHVLARVLFDSRSASFTSMMEKQRKMLDLSEDLWYQLIDTALLYKPDLVLIPGDLTKDDEYESHSVVKKGLESLKNAGIRALFIPGNHDLGGTPYQYMGEEKEHTRSLEDAGYDWDRFYGSLSEDITLINLGSVFVAEPFEGLTILGINGSNGTASVGSIDMWYLRFVLNNFIDPARKKGNMVIAMSHWQLMDHFDQQGTLEKACQFENAEAIRDTLMHHGVRLVLTGHFHVNSITTYRDTTGLTNDSIVEISTGSPITFPCPYRWLTISEDRARVDVKTDYLGFSATIGRDLYDYSEEWMREHTANLIPDMTYRAFNKALANLDAGLSSLGDMSKLEQTLGFSLKDEILSIIPDSAGQLDLVNRHLGQHIIDLYILHSKANESEDSNAQVIADAIYTGMEDMMTEMVGSNLKLMMILPGLKLLATEIVKELVQSIVEDVTHWRSTSYKNRTNDLNLSLMINDPLVGQGVDQVEAEGVKVNKVLREGHLLIEKGEQTYTLQGQKVQ